MAMEMAGVKSEVFKMLTPELLEAAINDLVQAYQQDGRDVKKLTTETVDRITNRYLIPKGESYSQEDYYQRIGQHVEYHRLTAARLLVLAQGGDQRLFQPAVVQTVSAFHVVTSHFNLGDLEKNATPLFVERPDLSPDYQPPNGGGIGDAIARVDITLSRLQEIKDRVVVILSPLLGHKLEAYSNSIIVPYGGQLVEMVSDFTPERARGKLLGLQDCVVNVGVENTSQLRQPLRFYPTSAYKRYCLCLELDQAVGKIRQSKPPVGIDKDLAGLGKVYIPIKDLDHHWNGLAHV